MAMPGHLSVQITLGPHKITPGRILQLNNNINKHEEMTQLLKFKLAMA